MILDAHKRGELLVSPRKSCGHCKSLLFCPRIERWHYYLEELYSVQPYSSQQNLRYFTGSIPLVWSKSFSIILSSYLYRKVFPRWEKYSLLQEQEWQHCCFLLGREPGMWSKWGGEERKNLLFSLWNSIRWNMAWWSGQLSAADGAQRSHEEQWGETEPLDNISEGEKEKKKPGKDRKDSREGW